MISYLYDDNYGLVHIISFLTDNNSMGECNTILSEYTLYRHNTILSAYTLYRHLG